MNIKILFIASECTPIAKVGGLGDVIGTLPKALKNLGIDVRICLPKYQVIDFNKYKFELIAKEIPVKDEKINIYQGFLPASPVGGQESSVILYLFENEKYFGENGVYLSSFDLKGIERFLFFSQAVLEIFPILNWWPDIIHCHDWHTAILPVLAKLRIKNLKFKIKDLLTIHNLADQGKWNGKEILDFLGLKGNEIGSLKIRDKKGDFNILQQGILNADLINTVSSSYTKEILTPEYGEGLENDLLQRKKDLFGILNGIDKTHFNPEIDPNLKANYSWKNLEKKIKNKIELQEILNFKKDSKIPLFGFIGRLTSQKGVDLIIEILPKLITLGYQFVILGVGMTDYEKKLLELSQKYPKNISTQIKFDPVLAQKIYAGSDFILIPSKFEPCGLIQMITMRYGTIPIARKTGGLTDTIEDKKTGFLFEEYKAETLLKTIKKAHESYRNKEKWKKMQKIAMKKDLSWKKSAREYFKLYQKLINEKKF